MAERERGSAPGKLGSVSRKGSKRTKNSAVDGANPTGDLENCVRCVNAWAMRRLGYDVAAVPGQPVETAEDSTMLWTDSKGRSPRWVSGRRANGALRWPEIQKELEGFPNGAWGFIRMKVRGMSHVGVWEKKNGELYMIDPQSPSIQLEFMLGDAVPDSIRWVDLSGTTPSVSLKELIEGSEL